jgi:small conductance mechanosensitive channel
MNELVAFFATYHPVRDLIVAIVIVLIGRWLARFISRLIERMMTAAHIEQTVINFVTHIASILVMVFAILMALGRLGIETTSILAVLGAAGLAIGLALQGSLSNLAAGVLLIIFRPFRQGDFIEAGGVLGTVQEIQMLTTVMNTPENFRLIVPNSDIMNGVITNYSVNETRRVDLTIGVSYDDDVRHVKQVLDTLVTENPLVLKEPAPFVAVSDFGDSSVNFVVWVWVKRPDFRQVRFGLPEQIKLTLDAHGITIPYPQRDLHLKNGVSQPQVQSLFEAPAQGETNTP